MKFPLLPHTLVKVIAIASLVYSLFPTFSTPTQAATRPGYMGKVAYTKGFGASSEIYVANADGTNELNLTNSSGVGEFAPKISPDGTSIIYYKGSYGSYDVYKMDSDGTNIVQLTNAVGNDNDQLWSPDGSKIVYSNDSTSDAYLINPDGSNKRQLISGGPVCNCYDIEWSLDMSKIYFAGDTDGDSKYDIYTVNANGTNLQKLTSFADGWDIAFDVSPDETKIAYSRQNSLAGGQQTIYVLDLVDSTITTITTGTDDEYNPKWSLDGTVLAYENWNTGNTHLVDPDGQNRRVLVSGSDTPRWTPDGKSILLTTYDDGQNIESTSLNGTNRHVFISGASSYGLTWSLASNVAPTTTNDTLTTPYNTVSLADVLINDTDEEALDGQYLTIATQPLNGTALVTDGKVKYTPNAGFKGSDELTYQICDSFLVDQKCATGVLGITVQAPGAPTLTVSKVDGSDYNSGTNKYTTTSKKPVFSGTASPGAKVKVEIHSDPILLTTTAGSDGNWSVTPTSDLPPGEHEVFISATLNGVRTELDSFVLAISDDATIPNTGTTTWPLRLIGLGMVGIGGVLVYWQRKRLHQVKYFVPSLWP